MLDSGKREEEKHWRKPLRQKRGRKPWVKAFLIKAKLSRKASSCRGAWHGFLVYRTDGICQQRAARVWRSLSGSNFCFDEIYCLSFLRLFCSIPRSTYHILPTQLDSVKRRQSHQRASLLFPPLALTLFYLFKIFPVVYKA